MISAPLTGRAAPPATDRELLFGVAGHAWWLDDHLDEFMAAYRDLGVTTVRLSVDWKYIEPSPGVYRWDRYDRVLRRLADARVVVVGVFVTVPAWAASRRGRLRRRGAGADRRAACRPSGAPTSSG